MCIVLKLLIWLIIIIFNGIGSNNFVYLADPCCLENILRAEGKYPRRDINVTPNTEWLLTDMGYPVTIGFRYNLNLIHTDSYIILIIQAQS